MAGGGGRKYSEGSWKMDVRSVEEGDGEGGELIVQKKWFDNEMKVKVP